MYSINEIINSLSADLHSDLLYHLLRIETEKNYLSDLNILVPQKINVTDGGEGGRIKWEVTSASINWLTNNLVFFQNKTTKLTPPKCFEDILETAIVGYPRKLKSQIEDVLINNGCYTFTINKVYNNRNTMI